ncbi:MAG: hypothetical protein NZ805_12540 [Armatimonadetes bacterium]|nr:hypothetical protein [Armatimonadota bacterium]MDW8029546.1 hypothetical protein [Armatimonadota bacterium]
MQTECRVASLNLDGASFVSKFDFGDRDLTIYLFRHRNGDYVLNVWTGVNGKVVPLRVQAEKAITVINHKGETQTVVPPNGQAKIIADFCPKLVRNLSSNVQVLRD